MYIIFGHIRHSLTQHINLHSSLSSSSYSGQFSVDLSSASLDGQEKWYALLSRLTSTDRASGEVSLVLVKGAAAPVVSRGVTATAIVEKVKQQIKQTQTNGGLSIDLTGCELTKLPNIIGTALGTLHNINLGFNKFIVFPELNAFKHLQTLDLNGNQITTLPQEITQLINLKGIPEEEREREREREREIIINHSLTHTHTLSHRIVSEWQFTSRTSRQFMSINEFGEIINGKQSNIKTVRSNWNVEEN
jgi:hypothetical protein